MSDARFGTRTVPRRRVRGGLWISVLAHATIAGVLTTIVPTRASENASAPRQRSIGVFVLAAPAPIVLPPIRVPAPRLPAPPRPLPPVPTPAIVEVHKPAPAAPIVTKSVEPAPAPPPPVAAPVFERPVAVQAPVLVRATETGLFERTNISRAAQSAASVTTGGFGSVASTQRVPANGSDEVRTAGFDRRASARAVPSVAQAATPIDRPVEILFKPSPEYTDEARSARIEGTVTLDLEFAATGEVRVLRVVSGLGHGLDEAAERAASRIKFKPAQSEGRAATSRATVYITFRLS